MIAAVSYHNSVDDRRETGGGAGFALIIVIGVTLGAFYAAGAGVFEGPPAVQLHVGSILQSLDQTPTIRNSINLQNRRLPHLKLQPRLPATMRLAPRLIAASTHRTVPTSPTTARAVSVGSSSGSELPYRRDSLDLCTRPLQKPKNALSHRQLKQTQCWSLGPLTLSSVEINRRVKTQRVEALGVRMALQGLLLSQKPISRLTRNSEPGRTPRNHSRRPAVNRFLFTGKKVRRSLVRFRYPHSQRPIAPPPSSVEVPSGSLI